MIKRAQILGTNYYDECIKQLNANCSDDINLKKLIEKFKLHLPPGPQKQKQKMFGAVNEKSFEKPILNGVNRDDINDNTIINQSLVPKQSE